VGKKRAAAASAADQAHEIQKIKLRNSAKKWDGFLQIIKAFIGIIPWTVAVLGCVLIMQSIAGKTTTFNGFFKLLVNLSADRWIAMLWGGGATAMYVRERRSHQRTIKQSADYQKKLEQYIDPDRSSSKLLPTGQTRKEDRE
jgi:hypothetical protein